MSIKDKIKETIKFIGNKSPQYKDGIALLNNIVDSLYINNMSDDEVMALFTTTALKSVIHMDPKISNDVYSIMPSFNRIHYVIHGHEEPLGEVSHWSDKKISKMTDGIDAERRSEIKNHIRALQQDPYQMKPVKINRMRRFGDLFGFDHDPSNIINAMTNTIKTLDIPKVNMQGWSDRDTEIFTLFVSTIEKLSDDEKNQILEILNNSKK
ncbi:hypothetical protein D1872_37060 [compost metagenome]